VILYKSILINSLWFQKFTRHLWLPVCFIPALDQFSGKRTVVFEGQDGRDGFTWDEFFRPADDKIFDDKNLLS